MPTFIQHSGNGKSQIDYFLTNRHNLLSPTTVDTNSAVNTSAHKAIKTSIFCKINSNKKSKPHQQKLHKILWKKGDIKKYQNSVFEQISKTDFLTAEPNKTLHELTEILQASTKQSIPTKVINLQGPRYRISQTTLLLVHESKIALREWRLAGSPRGTHPLFERRKNNQTCHSKANEKRTLRG